MAMSAGVAELTSVFSLTVIGQNQGATWQQGQELKVCSPSGAVFKKSRVAVTAAASQRESAGESAPKLSTLMSTAVALAGVALLAGNADAAMQKVEGTERETQDAVTTGIREPSRFSAAKSNSVQEAGKINSQASGGLILGAPRLDEPAGAYRSPQGSTYGVDETGGKRSTPAGILQGNSPGNSGGSESSEPAVIGGDARE
ncbi:uncharacterized protein [Physcomitrium patens]|uniref:Uncharacterized protein n=1 Tax=Physcomitrium patens TaxID=3218 RepID=A0A2K1IRI1_PHYPA|nr:uncharacterized protein LOC112274375 [Physcomitrium patens]PNR31877.1 hypothetical protein PHYPA_026000 [Physcomitrium patens]|eukprot:XP_024359587.1 uncharacterized protein LOC112274375 [Physcomitrella patens]